MSDLWIENLVLFAVVLLIVAGILASLKRLTRPRHVFFDRYGLDQQAARQAWSQHREEAYDAALRLAYENGDLTDALVEGARDVGDAFRVGREPLLVLDPWSRRV